MTLSVSQTPLLVRMPTSSRDYGALSEKEPVTNLIEIIQETPVSAWSALISPLMSCFSTCFPASESESAEFNEKNDKASALYAQQGFKNLPLTSEFLSQSAKINANSISLSPEVEKEIQECKEKVDSIINNSGLAENEVIEAVKKVLGPSQHIGVYFDTFNFHNLNYIRNCKIVLNSIAEKTNIESIRLHTNYFFADAFNSSDIIAALQVIFAKNTSLNYIDLSFDHAFNYGSLRIEQLRSLKEVLTGKKIANLDLSGNITRDFGYSNSTMEEICGYFGKMEITELHLDDTNFRGAHYELGLLKGALPNANGLKVLTLRNYLLQKMGADILFSTLGRTSIETLDLSGNNLTPSEKAQLSNRNNKFGRRINIIL